MKAEVSRLDDSEAKVAFARLCIITLDVHMTTVPRVSIVSVGKHLLSRSPLYIATIGGMYAVLKALKPYTLSLAP